MTTINSREFSANPIFYLNLASKESVAIKRGKAIFRIIREPEQVENLSPSGDPFWADPRNVAELERRIKERDEGKAVSILLTPEKRKEWFGNL